jgi:hypothetical protein
VSPGWAAELSGDKLDLDDCRHSLYLPHDPWVEEYEEQNSLLLRSAAWMRFDNWDDVLEDASRLIGVLNGALRV